jgi:cytochrome c peroxidase
MKTHVVVACLAMVGSSVAWSAANEPIQPIPAVKVTNPALVELGKKLYFDPACPSQVSSPAIPATTSRWGDRTT